MESSFKPFGNDSGSAWLAELDREYTEAPYVNGDSPMEDLLDVFQESLYTYSSSFPAIVERKLEEHGILGYPGYGVPSGHDIHTDFAPGRVVKEETSGYAPEPEAYSDDDDDDDDAHNVIVISSREPSPAPSPVKAPGRPTLRDYPQQANSALAHAAPATQKRADFSSAAFRAPQAAPVDENSGIQFVQVKFGPQTPRQERVRAKPTARSLKRAALVDDTNLVNPKDRGTRAVAVTDSEPDVE